jgi:hypothetical protein
MFQVLHEIKGIAAKVRISHTFPFLVRKASRSDGSEGKWMACPPSSSDIVLCAEAARCVVFGFRILPGLYANSALLILTAGMKEGW